MRTGFFGCSLAAGLMAGLGLHGAAAAMGPPLAAASSAIGSLVGPAAMCGISCRGGGRYIPGPPSVCRARGLAFCGASRDGAGSPPPTPDRSTSTAPDRRYWRFSRSDGSCAIYVHRRTGQQRTFCDD